MGDHPTASAQGEFLSPLIPGVKKFNPSLSATDRASPVAIQLMARLPLRDPLCGTAEKGPAYLFVAGLLHVQLSSFRAGDR